MTASPDIKSGSPERSGYSWGIFSEILPVHEVQFKRWTSSLPVDAWHGAEVLGVGCGMGRNIYWAIKSGAVSGRAIDVDERSLAGARVNLESIPVQVDHESAYDIADRNRFDIAFSIGVIHHLEDPELALSRMTQAVKPSSLYGRGDGSSPRGA